MKKLLIVSLATLITTALILNSCSKDKNKENEEKGKSVAADYTLSELVFGDVFKLSTYAMLKAEDSLKGIKTMPLAYDCNFNIEPSDASTFPKVIKMNFNTSTTPDADGVYRKGSLYISTTGWLCDSGTVINITPENFSTNNNSIKGTVVVTNKGFNSDGKYYFQTAIKGSVANSEGNRTFTTAREYEWVSGADSKFDSSNDIFMMRGACDGKTIKDEGYNVVVNTALSLKGNCKWISNGSVTIYYNNIIVIVNFGSGQCDSSATIMINGINYSYNLPF